MLWVVQVFAAQLDQFGDALELRSLPSRAANLMAGGGGGGAASPSSTGSQKPPGDESAQVPLALEARRGDDSMVLTKFRLC